MLEPLTKLADGTVKQVSPFNGTQVWTVPGRARRPYANRHLISQPIDHSHAGSFCSFCEHRYTDSPPERTRLVGERFEQIHRVPASQLETTRAEFRRVANLFPILPLPYWRANHGFELSEDARAWQREYISEPAGLAHLVALGQRLAEAQAMTVKEYSALPLAQQLAFTDTFFASSHELILARRHYVPDATDTTQLAGSGTLTPAEHAAYLQLTVDTARDLYQLIPQATYVTIFQNWLAPAGASFDHLHKQLAAIDQVPEQLRREWERARAVPDLYRKYGVDYAEAQSLIVASNDVAVAFAGYGHRFPSVEVHSLSDARVPWEMSERERRGLFDLVHAVHVAHGTSTPSNEEWYYQPPGVNLKAPVRVVVKARTAQLAGFEGATKIYLTTLSPWDVQERTVQALRSQADSLGRVTIA